MTSSSLNSTLEQLNCLSYPCLCTPLMPHKYLKSSISQTRFMILSLLTTSLFLSMFWLIFDCLNWYDFISLLMKSLFTHMSKQKPQNSPSFPIRRGQASWLKKEFSTKYFWLWILTLWPRKSIKFSKPQFSPWSIGLIVVVRLNSKAYKCLTLVWHF